MHNVGFRPTVGVLTLALAIAAALSSSERSEAQTYPIRQNHCAVSRWRYRGCHSARRR
jgi:hypothetical protein